MIIRMISKNQKTTEEKSPHKKYKLNQEKVELTQNFKIKGTKKYTDKNEVEQFCISKEMNS